MARIAYSNSKGFSLIELMIAIVIIMISMLAFLTSIVTSMRANLDNDLRNTSIRLTNQTAETLLALPMGDNEISSTSNTTYTSHTRTPGSTDQDARGFPKTVQTVRGTRQTYAIEWKVRDPSANVKEIVITVSYVSGGATRTNSSMIYKHAAL